MNKYDTLLHQIERIATRLKKHDELAGYIEDLNCICTKVEDLRGLIGDKESSGGMGNKKS